VPPGYDVIVVGGGAIGAACARELAVAGRRVLVLEPGRPVGQAWQAAAGMLAPQIEADSTDRLLGLGLAAREHYPPLAAVLLEKTGIDVGLWREGIARVAIDTAEAVSLERKVAWQQQQGYTAEWLQADELRRRWPWLGPVVGALWAPQEGALDPARLVAALLADAQRLDAEVVQDRAVGIEETGGRIAGVSGAMSRYQAPNVVVAAGAWSGLVQGLPRPLPIEPVRGQMAAMAWPSGVDRAIVYNKDTYLLARGDEAILGSTMEHVGFQPEVTSAGLARILTSTIALCPGLVRAKVRRSWAGLRPVTPDGLPVIGPDPDLEGLWYATGHGRNGILFAGLTGALVRQLVIDEAPSHDLSAFAPERFARP
jgi:glycine oxidase